MTFTLDQLLQATVWVLLAGGSTILFLVGIILKFFNSKLWNLGKRVDALEEEHNDHKVHVIENYVKASDLRVIIDPVFKKLDRMEDKINGIGFQLAEKQDRPR
jgi:hypothetical protein